MAWKEFFRRHDRLLSTVGTLILLLTFFFKEELREDWKHSAETIETAKYMFQLHHHLAEQDNALRELVSVTRDPKHNGDTSFTVNVTDSVGDMDIEYDRFTEAMNQEASYEFQSLEPLWEQLHDGDRMLEKAKGLEKAYEAWKDRNEDETDALKVEGLQADTNSPGNSAALRTRAAIFFGASSDVTFKFLSDVQELRAAVAEAADARLRKIRKYAAWANRISIALYILGALLSLAGKLAGGKAPEEEFVPEG